MYFTQEDFKKIEKWLLQSTVKDTQFADAATPLKGNETIAFVQGNQNVKTTIKDFVDQLFLLGVADFLNVTDKYGEKYLSIEQAIQLIPPRSRKIGQVITFMDTYGNWVIYQFQGQTLNQWNNTTMWINVISSIIVSETVPDEEDLTGIKQNNKLVLKFKNKNYSPNDFSGLGRVYLRKNIRGITDPVEGTIAANVLTQQMVSYPYTIYHLQYDYNLNGETIIIPEGCVILFEGGTLKNGTLQGTNTIIGDTYQNVYGQDLTLAGTFEGSISPLNFGLQPLDYSTSYQALYLTHQAAIATGLIVNYSGIKRINITVTADLVSIPLGNNTDFCGCEFHIENNAARKYLFSLGGERPRIELTGMNAALLKGIDYTSVPQLQRGNYILVVQDQSLWSKRQISIGNTDIYRYDIINIQDGYARSMPIMPYDTPNSNPSFYAVDVSMDKSPTICNGKFYRENSTQLTNLFIVEKVNDLTVKDIYIYTDKYTAPTNISADSTFYFDRVTNLTMDSIYQMNTYSQAASAATHGYFATFMSGTNIKLFNINAYDNDWGVIGSRCLNKVFVDKCNINRFDIHIYGRDVYIRDSIFTGRFCQFGGTYGDAVFDGCTFNKCTAAVICEQTFNYYTPFNLYFKNCVLNKTPWIYRVTSPNMDVAPIRDEQAKKYLPNIYIDGLTIDLAPNDSLRVIYNNGTWTPTAFYEGFYGLDNIVMRNVQVNYDSEDTRAMATATLQYNNITLLSTPHIVLDNCSFGKIKTEDQIPEATVSSNTETLRVNGTLLPSGKKGKFVIKNCLMALPIREYAPYDFTVEDSVLFNSYYSSLAANTPNHYNVRNTHIHFNRADINNALLNMGDYVGCDFIFYKPSPTLNFSNADNQGECNVIRCKTNRQTYGTLLAGRTFVPYSEANRMVIENEFMHLHISRNTNNGTVYTLVNQEVADSIASMPAEAYNYAKILQEVSQRLVYQRVKVSGEADAPWETRPVAVIWAGPSTERPLSASRAGMTYYDYTLRRLLVWSGEVWRYANSGFDAKYPERGTTEERPELTSDQQGFWYFDTTYREYIYWDGYAWFNSDATVANNVIIL